MVFEGTAYVMPLLGAYLADSFWGRFKTILVFSTIYLVGAAACLADFLLVLNRFGSGWGRFKAIHVFSPIYLVGACCCETSGWLRDPCLCMLPSSLLGQLASRATHPGSRTPHPAPQAWCCSR